MHPGSIRPWAEICRIVEGGGGAPYPSIRVYVLILLRQMREEDPKLRSAAATFVRLAKFTNRTIGCEIANPDIDTRCQESLERTKEGRDLWRRIAEKLPCVCVSSSYIGNPMTTGDVEIIPMLDDDAEARTLAAIERFHPRQEERRGICEFLQFVEAEVFEYVEPKLNLFGFEIKFRNIVTALRARYCSASLPVDGAATNRPIEFPPSGVSAEEYLQYWARRGLPPP